MTVAVSIGLSWLAGELLKKQNKSLVQDDRPTTVATRGAYLPRLIGRRRVGFVFAAAGNRQRTKEASPGGKGGDVGGLLGFQSDPVVQSFTEEA